MIQIQSNPYQRARGAIGRLHGLGDRTLAFVYPHASRRIYSTWLCPPLRVLCFGEGGDVIFNQVVTKWSLIRLPETRLVIEMDPARAYLSLIREVAIVGTKRWIRQHVSNQNELMQSVGGTPTDDPFGKLLFAMIRDEVEDLGRVRNLLDAKCEWAAPAHLEDFPLWRQGQILCSAGFLLD